MSTKAVLALLLSLTSTGCEVYTGLTMPAALKEAIWAPTVPMRSILFEGRCFKEAQMNSVVFRTQADLDTFLRSRPIANWDGNGRRYTLPPVDFAQEQAILVEAGYQDWGGQIEVVAVEERENSLFVRTVIWVPSPEGISPASVSSPVHYLAIPRTEKEIVFSPFVMAERDDAPSRAWPGSLPMPLSTNPPSSASLVRQ